MRIAIDISPIVYGTGVSVYTKKLVENLLLIDDKNEYVLFGASLRKKQELVQFIDSVSEKLLKHKIVSIPPTLADVIWNRLHIIPIESFIGKVDIFHSSDWTQPPSSARTVTTVHDLAPIKFPESTHPKIVSVHTRRLQLVKKYIQKVIVPTKTTKADLVEFGVKEKRIEVIAEATAFRPVNDDKVKKVRRKHHIRRNYLLSVGINPRKNTKRIIKAYNRVKTRENLDLVLVGQPLLGSLDKSIGVKVLGHVSDQELAALYTGAEILVYPSLYEGFGLPILDAFSCNVPVVTSDIGSMKEVAGDAAVLVNPLSIEAIAEGIEKVLKNKNRFVNRGKLRLKMFSWKKTAKKTLELYNDLKN